MKNFTLHSDRLAELRQALRCRACGICIHAGSDGSCEVDFQHDCALFERLAQVVETTSRIHSVEAKDYSQALQETVCDQCFHQQLNGFCELRSKNHCALFRYLIPVIAVIEDHP